MLKSYPVDRLILVQYLLGEAYNFGVQLSIYVGKLSFKYCNSVQTVRFHLKDGKSVMFTTAESKVIIHDATQARFQSQAIIFVVLIEMREPAPKHPGVVLT